MSRYTPSTARGSLLRYRSTRVASLRFTVDCEDIHILTDIISLEQWWAKKKQERS